VEVTSVSHVSQMKTISIRQLHTRTGWWVRLAAELGAITVTDRGRPVARLHRVGDDAPTNPFRARRVRPGYARLRGKLGRGTDSTLLVSESRDRPSTR
jgi:antitoxin (DNA-binding transcriptional repressor) of toxin-antitoxin stability system